jgi:uncharacterized protein (DUF433 family)
MVPVPFRRIGKGVYSLAEAERLVKVSRHRIRRWTRGYTYRYKGEVRHTPPIIAEDTKQTSREGPLLSFLDLLEVRFLNAFLEHGVSWKAIRIAALNARMLLGRHHPFSTRIFKTDGQTILAEIAKGTGDKLLLDLVKNQYVFEQIIAPYLYEGIEFNAFNDPERWWPLGKKHAIVIDPERGFGAPIVARSGVPTKILTDAVKAEGSIEFVAKWYEVTRREVRDAVKFEEQLAA